MKKIKIILLCLIAALPLILSSCTMKNTVEPNTMPTPAPVYVLEYVKGVTILRRVP